MSEGESKPLTEAEARQIAEAVVESLTSDARARWIPSEQHAKDHELIAQIRRERQQQAQRDQERDQISRNVKTRIIGGLGLSGILALLGLMGYGIIYLIQEIITKPPANGG